MRPQEGPQTAFLSSSADVVVLGGAAGVGKTWALLIEPLRHVKNPDFGAVIFRRTFSEIRLEGGMWEESEKIYPHAGATPSVGRLLWTFPSGARVRFAYLRRDKDRLTYQGAQIPLLCFDQLERFSKTAFFYLFSRNRSLCGVKPYIRATCNPDPDSWLASFLSWWIGEDGYARADRAGKVRWFIRAGDDISWADTRAELLVRHASYLETVDAPPGTLVKSASFIPGNVYDNEILLAQNPEYLANLLALPWVERERLLHGNWRVRAAAGKVFKREWFEIVDAQPAQVARRVRFWDLAATEKKQTTGDPDYTAGVRMSVTEDGVYYVEHVVRVRARWRGVKNLILQTAKVDGTDVHVGIEQEPGAAGKALVAEIVTLLKGYVVRSVPSRGDKVARANPVSSQAEVGNVKVVRGPWNEPWLDEMENFPDGAYDDQVDATSGAFDMLTRGKPRRGYFGMV